MAAATLDRTTVLDTYLRGVNLGVAWTGSGGGAAIDQLIRFYTEMAEARLGVALCRRRVLTYPDAGVTQGQGYEVLGYPFPYLPPLPGASVYALTLPYPQVQSVERVRVFEGYDTGLPPAPLFETIPLAATDLSMLDGRLRFATSYVTAPQLAQSWAVDYTIGLGHLPAELAEWISLRVSMQVLSLAASGADLSGGRAGWRLSMDGLDEEQRYGTGKDGPFSTTLLVMQGLLADLEMPAFWRTLRIRLQGTRWAPQGWQQP
jgi:hypothetical protein